MAIYELKVYENDFREYLDGHDWLERLSDSQYEEAADIIVDKATSSRGVGFLTDFEEWFMRTTYYDEVQDNIANAIDEYIDLMKDDTLKALED